MMRKGRLCSDRGSNHAGDVVVKRLDPLDLGLGHFVGPEGRARLGRAEFFEIQEGHVDSPVFLPYRFHINDCGHVNWKHFRSF